MQQTVIADNMSPLENRSASSRHSELRHAIEHAAHLLPAQGPITAFVHHNTLHALESQSFSNALVEASATFGCHTYLTEPRYRRELRQQRIRVSDLHTVLLEDMGDSADVLIGCLGTRFHLRLAMLQYPMRFAPRAELQWLVEETDVLNRFRGGAPLVLRNYLIGETRHWIMRDLRVGAGKDGQDISDRPIAKILGELDEFFPISQIERWSDKTWEAFCLHLLWRIASKGIEAVPLRVSSRQRHVRHRDVLLEATGQDSDVLVHDVLIRFCAAFLDQGFAAWSLPRCDGRFYSTFCSLYRQRGGVEDDWMQGLHSELDRLIKADIQPLDSIAESLELLGVAEHEIEEFISESLLALRGWAGMIWQMETRQDRVAHAAPKGSLVEYLAVRFLLERFALAFVARQSLRFDGSLAELRQFAAAQIPTHQAVTAEQRAFLVFQLAQVRGWKPEELYSLSAVQWRTLVREIESFSSMERRRIFHLAYERRFRIQTLDAIGANSTRMAGSTVAPAFQVICCLDEREESFRRHLEELRPDVETFGTAGFFGVAMYYRGAADAHYVPLCPVVIRPQHYVQEVATYTLEETHRRRKETRRILGTASHQVHIGSRTLLGGALAALLGPFASVPLVARVLFPRLTSRIRRRFGQFVQPPAATQLLLERTDLSPGPEPGHIGFTVDEMAAIVERILRDIGLTSEFSRLVIVMGHGSFSLNNPHKAAYDCGACGGGHGGPNARAFAMMANHLRVREKLAARGLVLPGNVFFLGAFHNTCDDSVTYYDLDEIPASHRPDFEAANRSIDVVRQRNAHERCRRFESAPLSLSAEGALRHVEERAEDLAQARPECGHATNAICFVGRRARTRGLYLDRRAFLTSYDPTQDDQDYTILTRILQAVVPICGGINLEYYFSYVDSCGFGCGTKLPHNITSLLGVMDGAASDLRTGLPWQMVEIHEPVRLLFIVEASPDVLLRILNRDAVLNRLCRNGWVQLASLAPESADIHVFRQDSFSRHEPERDYLPRVNSSFEWYRGWRDHLGCARVETGGPASGRNLRTDSEHGA